MGDKIQNSISIRRDAFYERSHLFVPGDYVVIKFRVLGRINEKNLVDAIIELRKCHPMIGVHVEFDAENRAWFVSENTPMCPLKVFKRENDSSWLKAIYDEYKTPFTVTKGPLIRFLWIHSDDENVSELIAFAQHAICDGLSLVYLLRDMMQKLGNPEIPLLPKTYIPTFKEIYDLNTIKFNPLVKLILSKFNAVWKKHNLIFTEEDLRPLHDAYLSLGLNVIMWKFDAETTQKLISACHRQNVSVNSALYSAILNAQYQLQGEQEDFRKNILMPISIRNYVYPPIGEGVGLFAGGETLPIKMKWNLDFWAQVKYVHKVLQKRITPNSIFSQAKKMTLLEPSLMEGRSLMFLGLLKPDLPKYQELLTIMEEDKLLAKIKQKRLQSIIQMGSVLTNLGSLSIPEIYGSLKLEEVLFLPPISPFAEKLIGVVTFNNELHGSIAFTKTALNPNVADQFKVRLIEIIKDSLT